MASTGTDSRLTHLQLIAWALPTMVLSLSIVPVNAVLPTLYAQHAQVSVTAVGTVFLLRSIYDAASDQLIGYLSDCTRTRIGARLPWILSGALVTIVGLLMLFRIPADAGVAYFAVWTMVYFTGATMMGIPYFAWGNELTSDYTESSRVFAYKSFFESAGSMAFSVIPMVVVFLGIAATTEYTVEMIWLLGLITSVALFVTLAGAFFIAPRGRVRTAPRTTLLQLFHSVMGNRPFHRFFSAYIIAGLGYGFFVALVYPFISSYLQIGSAFPMILLVATICSLAGVPLWMKIVSKLGKHRSWSWGWIINSLVLVPMIWVKPGESAVIPAAVMMGLYGLTNAVSAIAPFSILGDVVDYDRLRTGIDRSGNYFAFIMFAVKLLGSAGGVALIVLGSVFGYQLAEGSVNTEFANNGMLYMFILAPGIFQMASVALIWNFPIDQRRQGIIRRRLDSLDARADIDAEQGVLP